VQKLFIVSNNNNALRSSIFWESAHLVHLWLQDR